MGPHLEDRHEGPGLESRHPVRAQGRPDPREPAARDDGGVERFLRQEIRSAWGCERAPI